MPIVWLTSRYQIRTTFGILGLLSGIATLMIPTAARLGINYFLAIRAIQGVAFAANFCVIGSFTTKWTYFKQVEKYFQFYKTFEDTVTLLLDPKTEPVVQKISKKDCALVLQSGG